MGLRARLREFLRRSSFIHQHEQPANTPAEFIDLADRFVDSQPRYPLEWDDFISWDNSNPELEAVRNRIGELETALFSGSTIGRKMYANRVIEERDRLAAILGRPARGPVDPFSGRTPKGEDGGSAEKGLGLGPARYDRLGGGRCWGDDGVPHPAY
jgi:hypothetical protein